MMDFVDVCSSPSGVSALLVFVDMASRYVMLSPVKQKSSAEVISAFRRWRLRFGSLPSTVLCDQGSHFTAKSLVQWLVQHGICTESLEATPYNSQGRGRVESVNKRILHWLKIILPSGKSEEWVDLVDELELALNATVNRTTGISPFQFIYNFPPQLPLQWVDPWSALSGSEDIFTQASIVTQARRYLATVRAEMEALTSAAARNSSVVMQIFNVGDAVLLYHPKQDTKLSPAWRGIFEVVHVELDPDGNRTHFYSVKYCLPGHSQQRPLLGPALFVRATRIRPFNASRTSPAAEAERELPQGWRVVDAIQQGPRLTLDAATSGHFLVKWHGVSDPSWEPPSSLIGNKIFTQYCSNNGLDSRGVPLSAALARASQQHPIVAALAPIAAAPTAAKARAVQQPSAPIVAAEALSAQPSVPLVGARPRASARQSKTILLPAATEPSAASALSAAATPSAAVEEQVVLPPAPLATVQPSTTAEAQVGQQGIKSTRSKSTLGILKRHPSPVGQVDQPPQVVFWEPRIGQCVEARQHERGQWHSATIHSLEPESAQVQWSSGTLEHLPFNFIRQLQRRRKSTGSNL